MTNLSTFRDTNDCPVRGVLSHLLGKWPALVMLALLDGPQRFSTLHHRIENLSRRMLTVTLRQLERDGFIARRVYAEAPPKVEYSLTALGEDALRPLTQMIRWAESHQQNIREARTRFDEAHVPRINY